MQDLLSGLLDAFRLEQADWHERPVPLGPASVGAAEIRVHGVIEGAVRLSSGAREVELTRGDIAILRPGTAYRLGMPVQWPTQAEGDGRALSRIGPPLATTVQMFSGNLRLALLRGPPLSGLMPDLLVLPNVDGRPAPWVRRLGEIAGEANGSELPGSAVVRQRVAELFVIQAIRNELAAAAAPHQAAGPLLHHPQMVRAIALMRGRMSSTWSLGLLARAVGMSRSAFAATFAAVVGEPPLQHLARMRVAAAAQILRATELSLGEVAACVGYGSDQALARAFKRYMRCSPGRYRRMAQLGGEISLEVA